MTSDRLRDFAYYCFLGLAACVVVVFLGDLLGRYGRLPQPVAAGLLVFVLMPLTFCAIAAGLVGSILTVIVRRDLRLFVLSILTAGLVLFWLRKGSDEAGTVWVLTYPVGVLLFSLRWLWQKKSRPHGPPHPPVQELMGENPWNEADGADRTDGSDENRG